jgi:hypothetical protein
MTHYTNFLDDQTVVRLIREKYLSLSLSRLDVKSARDKLSTAQRLVIAAEREFNEQSILHKELASSFHDLRRDLKTQGIEFKIEDENNGSFKVFLKRTPQSSQSSTSTTPLSEPLKHRPNCSTNFFSSEFDDNCPRCKKIKIIIHLRRRNQKNGSSPEEEQIAFAKANQLMIQYGIKRAEVLDRLFGEIETPQASYKPTSDPAWRNWKTPPPPPPPPPQYASNTVNFSNATPPKGSRMRANYPRGRIRKDANDLDEIG